MWFQALWTLKERVQFSEGPVIFVGSCGSGGIEGQLFDPRLLESTFWSAHGQDTESHISPDRL